MEDSVELSLESEADAPRSLLAARLQSSRLGAQASPNFNPHSLLEQAPQPEAEPPLELDLTFAGGKTENAATSAQVSAPAGGTEGGAKAQFLALVAPNVVLFAHDRRYFMAQGSALFAHFLAQVYRQGVVGDTVERCELTLPFALRLEPGLLKAYKQTQLVSAAARAGFVVKSQLTRSAIELIAIPKMVRGTNLAQVAGQALALIAASHEVINSAGTAPEPLVKCISQAKRYELNTVLDAKALIEHLQPSELEVLVSEATSAQGTLDAKTKLNLSLKREGFTICELDLCSLAYQMLGQHK